MTDLQPEAEAPAVATICTVCARFPRHERHALVPGCIAHRNLKLCHSPGHGMTVDRGDGRGRVCLECDLTRCKRTHDGKYAEDGPEAAWLTREREQGEETMDDREATPEEAVPVEPVAEAAPEAPEAAPAPEGEAPPEPQQMVTLSPGEGALYLEIQKGVQLLFAGHQITHEVLGALVRHLQTGENLRMSPAAWTAIGVDPKSRPLIVSPNGLAL